jgi:FkbM family methyltransferase
MVVYDIGANAGVYTLLFSRRVGRKGKVFAFEPFGENAANLLHHINLNKLENVTLVQSAVSDKSGLTSFSMSKSNSMGVLSNERTLLRVPTITIDDLLEKFDFPLPHLVKMDVEGAEAAVLVGAAKLLSYHSTIWFVALHGRDQKRACQRIFEDSEYELFELDGSQIRDPLEYLDVDEIYAAPKCAS